MEVLEQNKIILKELASIIVEYEHRHISCETIRGRIPNRIKQLINILTIKSNNPLELHGCYYDDCRELDESKVFEYSGFLLYDLCGHSGDVRIVEIESLAEVESVMLGGGGIFNMFTTEMFVIENNKINHLR